MIRNYVLNSGTNINHQRSEGGNALRETTKFVHETTVMEPEVFKVGREISNSHQFPVPNPGSDGQVRFSFLLIIAQKVNINVCYH